MALNKEVIYTIKGELVKSKGEALIANFLFRNNIDYEYEKIYENLMPERRSYHPDFTLSLHGQPVYIEYFGLSTYEDNELSRYNKYKLRCLGLLLFTPKINKKSYWKIIE